MMQKPFSAPRLLIPCALAVAAMFLLCPGAQAASQQSRQHRSRPLVVGYFPGWGQTYAEPFNVKAMIGNHSARMLDQINYSQGAVAGGRCAVSYRKSDLDTVYTRRNSVNGRADNPRSPFRGYFHQLKELKLRYPHLKILISLEGAPEGFREGAKPENRRAFVASCVDTFLRGNFAPGIHEPGLFDGFDIDWESPQQNEAADFLALVAEFRRQMDAYRPGLRLAIAVGEAPQELPGTDFAALSALVDQVGIMNYDYTGPWSPTTGFIAPLYSNLEDPHQASSVEQSSNSIEQSIANYQARGVPVKKMLMGLPFYGYSWTTVNDENDGLFQSGKGAGDDRPYHYIRALAEFSSVHRDARTQAPWLFDGQIFWTYEDPVSIRYKVSYAANQHLAGVMIWELSGDTKDAELLRSAHHSLRNPMVTNDVDETATTDSNPPTSPAN